MTCLEADLRKVELHCHLDGVLTPAMVRDIRRETPAFPIDPAGFERAYPIKDLPSFWRWFDFVKPLYGSLEFYYPILKRHIERLKAHGVDYAEVMVPGSAFLQGPIEAVEKMRPFREWANQVEAGDIQVEFLICLGRNKAPDEMARRAEPVLALYAAGLIVGVALAGPEQGYPVKPFYKTFARFHEAGMGIEVHAGEWCGPDSVWDALNHGFPHRLGHGVSLFQDHRLIELVRERGIHIEMCPTSNVKTGSILHIEEHPLRRAKELGLSFSVNTDDPGPFECSMESEYALVSEALGFDRDNWRTVYTNALAARFQPRLRLSGLHSHESKER